MNAFSDDVFFCGGTVLDPATVTIVRDEDGEIAGYIISDCEDES